MGLRIKNDLASTSSKKNKSIRIGKEEVEREDLQRELVNWKIDQKNYQNKAQ